MTPITNRIGLLTRADGSEVRRLVVYMPPEVMQRLRSHCSDFGISLSVLTTAAVVNHLDAEEEQ